MSRPAETIQAVVSGLIGAALIIYGATQDGIDLTDLQNPEVAGAITLIVGFVSAVVTWYTARKQRDPANAITSGADGTVQGG